MIGVLNVDLTKINNLINLYLHAKSTKVTVRNFYFKERIIDQSVFNSPQRFKEQGMLSEAFFKKIYTLSFYSKGLLECGTIFLTIS